mmetsp:Transcript_11061/g.20843  ORF Transcript_11061/g.20843 Transcript_11061/m.20843 type:complete len:143 (-) Transcript_11061:391-819(-)
MAARRAPLRRRLCLPLIASVLAVLGSRRCFEDGPAFILPSSRTASKPGSDGNLMMSAVQKISTVGSAALLLPAAADAKVQPFPDGPGDYFIVGFAGLTCFASLYVVFDDFFKETNLLDSVQPKETKDFLEKNNLDLPKLPWQ